MLTLLPARVPAHARIVVGVDNSRTSAAALAWAVAHVRDNGGTLVVVHAYLCELLTAKDSVISLPSSAMTAARIRAERNLTAALAGVPGELVSSATVVHRPTIAALLSAASGAHLLVIGAKRQTRRPYRPVPGSVVAGVLAAPPCAVIVLQS